MQILYSILVILGALAVFLFGMKLMSESLQKLAGHKMRNYLSTITSNPWRGMATGFMVTAILQSSSASTVMLIGFVNAGLITVLESVGLVFGANLGTTITAWLITFFGFSFDIKIILLPLIAFSIPFYLTSNSTNKSIAEFIMGFSIMFFGLQFLREALPNIDPDSGIIQLLSEKADQDLGSLLLLALAGFAITLVIQSSTASTILTMVLYSDGFMGFEAAGAMIIGQNIGTTITANIAALVGNRASKRTALIHFLFNLIGAILFIPFYHTFIYAIEQAVNVLISFDLLNEQLVKPLKISIFHSGFNLITVIILLWFIKSLVKISTWFIPVKALEDQHHKLTYHDSLIVSISELSISHVSKELDEMACQTGSMFAMIPRLLLEKDVESYEIMYHDLKRREERVDKLELEIMNYLTKVSENKLSVEGSRMVHAMLNIVNNLESIADVCFKMSRIIDNKNKQKAWFTQKQRDKLFEMFELVEGALNQMLENIRKFDGEKLTIAEEIEKQINRKRRSLIDKHLSDLEDAKYHINSGNFYQQLIVYSEKIGDHAINVSEALSKSSHAFKPNHDK
jgi:phosphate:Na+ symporter